MKLNRLVILLIITLLGGFIRFWQVNQLPVSPNWDEVSHGYNAYSILKTGNDEWGNKLPLIFKAYGDYKLPVYIYSTILPVLIFGLNTFSVRFISILSGVLAIPGIYLLANIVFKDKKHLGLISAFLLAISPWHFFISRIALEANLALTLTIYGIYFLFSFIESKNSLLPASILLGLTLHTYNTSRIFVPLMVIIFTITYFSAIRKNLFNFKLLNFLAIFVFTLSIFLVSKQVLSGEGTARYDKVKILSPAVVYEIGEKRSLSPYSPLVSKLLYNRPVHFVTTFVGNYFSYFSPNFLSQSKGSQYQFAFPGKSLFTWPVTVLAVVGLFYCFSQIKKERSVIFLLLLLLASPVAASLTLDPPQAVRPTPMIPFVIIMASIVFSDTLLKKVTKITNLVFALVLLSCSVSSVYYLYEYHHTYSMKYSKSWQYGYKQVIDYALANQSNYQKIFITKKYGEPHMFYAFYSQLNPKIIQSPDKTVRFGKSDWFWTDRIENVYFLNDWQIPTSSQNFFILESGQKVLNHNSLLITTPDHVPENSEINANINYLDGSSAFIITSIP